jgi:hypothetical protein
MNKWLLSLATALALTGCGNFRPEFGIPTVTLSVSSSNVVTRNVGTTANPVLESTREVVFHIYSEPGSPGGLLLSINLADGTTLPSGGRVTECPVNGKPVPPGTAGPNTCPATAFAISIALPTSGAEPKRSVDSYVVQGLNGASRTFQLPVPLPLN